MTRSAMDPSRPAEAGAQTTAAAATAPCATDLAVSPGSPALVSTGAPDTPGPAYTGAAACASLDAAEALVAALWMVRVGPATGAGVAGGSSTGGALRMLAYPLAAAAALLLLGWLVVGSPAEDPTPAPGTAVLREAPAG